MARKINFRGKTLDELKAMTIDEVVMLFSSSSRRAVRRASMNYRKLIEKISRIAGKKPIKTHVRAAVILPAWVGTHFKVHNGKEYKDVMVTEAMIGHRLGEYSHTTSRVLHSGPGVGATRGSKFIPLK